MNFHGNARNTSYKRLTSVVLSCAFGLICGVSQAVFADDVTWEKLNEEGIAATKDSDYEKAENVFKEAEEKLKDGHQDADLATIKHHMAELYEKQGKYQLAEDYYKEAIGLRQEALGNDHPLTGRSMVNYARMLDQEGRHEEAGKEYTKAQGIMEKSLGGDHPNVGTLADIVNWFGQGIDADKEVPIHAKRSANTMEKSLGADHPDVGEKFSNMGDMYRAHGKYEQAEHLYKKGVADDKEVEPTDPGAAKRFMDLASNFQHQGKMEEAEQYFQKAEAALENSAGVGADKAGTTYNTMAKFYEAKGDFEQADKYYKSALKSREEFTEGVNDLDTEAKRKSERPVAETLNDYAKFLHKAGKDEAADKLEGRARDILEEFK